MKFEDFNLSSELMQGIREMNIEIPTEIQVQAIPKILELKKIHVLAQAKTGSGKTLAFSIPIAKQIDPNLKKVQAVILVPTRELCKQVYDVFSILAKYKRILAVEVYGGVSIERQISLILDGAQIVIATPGRLIDIYQRKVISFNAVQFLVLDEADRMLDMGFYPDIDYLLHTAMHGIRPRLLLFSATLTHEIKEIAKKFNEDGEIVEIDVSRDELTVENCQQFYYLIEDHQDKYYDFIRILRQTKPTHSIIFVNTKKTAEWLFNRIIDEKGLNLKIELIQGDLSQNKREQVLQMFRNRRINCLIATDVAARGLDIPEITHIFNYDIPQFEENYVHRIGRTSRMDRPGTAISLCLADEYNFLCRIEGFMKKDIQKLPLPLHQRREARNPRVQSKFFEKTQNSFRDHSTGTYKNPPNRKFIPKKRGEEQKEQQQRRNFLY